MAYNSQTISTTGAATPIGMDWTVVPFNASFAVELQGATTATFSVQFTLDDLNLVTTATWFTDTNVGLNSTASSVGNYTFPIRFVRVNCTALSASGSILFNVIQGLPV